MYIVTNLSVTPSIEKECDAIENVIYENGEYIPADNADGFKALTIVHISPTEEKYIEEIYTFEGRTLSGNEPYGEYKYINEEEK